MDSESKSDKSKILSDIIGRYTDDDWFWKTALFNSEIFCNGEGNMFDKISIAKVRNKNISYNIYKKRIQSSETLFNKIINKTISRK